MKPLKKFSTPQIITDNSSLKEMVDSLLDEKFVTMDTEFVREATYWPILCLIQIAGDGHVYLIDALSETLDLSLLSPLLLSPHIVKVFHAAQQDLEIFLHLFGFLPVSIFDTQIAAMVAGFGNQIGYDSLVESLLKHRIDKSYRFSDWSIRPLTQAQQDYAAADVTFLWDVYKVLLQKLTNNNRLSWVESEMQLLSNSDFFSPPLHKMWRKLGGRIRNRYTLGYLYYLIEWREGEAQRLNIPRHHVIKDECLVAVAVALPDSVQRLERIRGIDKEFAAGERGQSLLKTIGLIKEIEPDALPLLSFPKNNNKKASEGLIALLKVMLLAKCEAYNVAPKLVIDNKDIEKIALGERDLDVFSGWRNEVFGKDALDLCQGKLMLGVKDTKVEFIRC